MIKIDFESSRCIHSRTCVLGRPDVFVPNAEGPWIHPDAAPAEAIVEIAHGCPSGAIQYKRLDGPSEEAPIVNLIRVRENGPYAIHAQLTIGGAPDGMRRTLCRCGASRAKPYCDGSHHEAGFLATGEPDTRPSEPLAVRNGLLDVEPLPNGPLKVTGAMEIVSGTGRTVDRKMVVALCRCGASTSKPYCDGSHARIGFTDQ
ncbi:CDGSH iron-sulfur domain-containing protein [Ensifer adhaerens]|nr:CDGSH iron-sulfur domain-containing protein [Ensifer adhaerens]MBZ7924189.1 CDGSH iron-sulfur domain-containing protein [Ensifer adhaerens]UAX97587.1 CDGSH iron-sulfur domain-containing protein [Ensifer adhaerens]UAY05022.1 CDGSH iron-sulfur domain-containing protein [Ensifer adhaerens]UAY12442.1 CDGSH iron-sulfur domain-containing protein [Ensifer adhaerens]